MSQDDIIKILEKKKEPLTSKELSEMLKITQQSILRSLNKLLKYKEIKSCKVTNEELDKRGYSKRQRGMRFWLYYIK